MSTAEQLTQDFSVTTWIIKKQAEGLSNEEMTILPPFRANCFNWVLGHIATNRDKVLTLLGKEALFTPEQVNLYERGSEPMTDGETAVPGDKLLTAIDQSNERIATGLQNTPVETLTAIYNKERNQTVAERIAGLHWHETYHTGQLELLRQLAGKNDTVIP
ncbi:MAG: DinB family protein [Chloroflexi bacterium]|nr:DinB family protein [Chloroflexota bacterium]